MIATLAAAILLQPKLDFGPEIVSIPDLCLAYLPDGAVMQVEDDLNDRWAVVRLKGRTWEEVRVMLRTGFGVSSEQDDQGVWQLKGDPEARRLADIAVSRVASAVEKAAQKRLEETHSTQEPRAVHKYEQEFATLMAMAQGYTLRQTAQFISNSQERLNWLRDNRDLKSDADWMAYRAEASGLRPFIQRLETRTGTWPGSAVGESAVRLIESQADILQPDQIVVECRQRFDWGRFAVDSRVTAATRGLSVTSPRTRRVWHEYPAADREAAVLFPPKGEIGGLQASWLDSPVSAADNGPLYGLAGQALKWGRGDAELIVESHPLVELGPFIIYFGRNTTPRTMLDAWLHPDVTPAKSMQVEPDQEDGEIAEYHVRTFIEEFPSFLAEAYAGLHLSEYDGVLLSTPAARPLMTRLNLPARDFWPLVKGGYWNIDLMREYARRTSPEKHLRWSHISSLLQLDFYPIVRAIELLPAKEKEAFWKAALTSPKAQIKLTAPAARSFFEGLPVGEGGEQILLLPDQSRPGLLITAQLTADGSNLQLTAETQGGLPSARGWRSTLRVQDPYAKLAARQACSVSSMVARPHSKGAWTSASPRMAAMKLASGVMRSFGQFAVSGESP